MKRCNFFSSLLCMVAFFCGPVSLICMFTVVETLIGMAGCSAQKPITAATVNQTITTAIADAGTVAILAEQQYQAGTIPQTATNRTLINDLGNAYNQAKTVYQQVLSAEAAANGATQAQIAACAPAAVNSTACGQATQAAQVAAASVTQQNATLQNTVNALVTQTSSVKAIVKP
jgi:hypothetical protein